MLLRRLAPALLASLMTGCVGGDEPLLVAYNETSEPVEIAVAIRDTEDLRVVESAVFFLGPSDYQERAIDLDGTYNVTAFTAAGLRAARELDFWKGNILGGQMYAEVALGENGLLVTEGHAD